jgi:hypothetical protein
MAIPSAPSRLLPKFVFRPSGCRLTTARRIGDRSRGPYRRIELVSKRGTDGEFRCLLCNHLLEAFDGSTEVAIRLTVQPAKMFEQAPAVITQ